jgi:hypothetical protein
MEYSNAGSKVQETEVTAGVKVQEIEQLKVLRTYFQ